LACYVASIALSRALIMRSWRKQR